MYISLNTNGFYTGNYSDLMPFDGSIIVYSLPPMEDYSKSLFYKPVNSIIQEEQRTPIYGTEIDVETGMPIIIDWNITYVDKNITTWTFYQAEYDAWVIEQAGIIPPLTTEEEIIILKESSAQAEILLFDLIMNILPTL